MRTVFTAAALRASAAPRRRPAPPRREPGAAAECRGEEAAPAPASALAVYVLRSRAEGSAATYCGVTRDLRRRLEQHNGERKGGAKATAMNRPWEYLCVLEGFPCDRAARQCEWAMKHGGGGRAASYRGPEGRLRRLRDLLAAGGSWTKAGVPLSRHAGLRVLVHPDFLPLLEGVPAAAAGPEGPSPRVGPLGPP
uniref:Structure-specific endonuclease subunit SLX1 n=1 Tax=Tetraselmis sp. GSL018 TaxID=582737 RepID=A0A061SM45_9CHLO|mmetsp:Transcript_33503/g.79491  ORF Transcript_33503/g.79491 Transcript_33503/m.79491 type:complete len:195 (+) Transcript_33503:899-1483(+)